MRENKVNRCGALSMFGLSKKEYRFFKALRTPQQLQTFINTLQPPTKKQGDTCYSPRKVLKKRHANCIEGALLAALALRVQGYPPLLLDLEAAPWDLDHVIAVYKKGKHWGAISKTNHAVLRYRDPVYASIRELVMSFFHEYTTDDGRKSLRRYTNPINLSQFDAQGWMQSLDEVWYIANCLADAPHLSLISRSHIARLRCADPIERKVGAMKEWNN